MSKGGLVSPTNADDPRSQRLDQILLDRGCTVDQDRMSSARRARVVTAIAARPRR